MPTYEYECKGCENVFEAFQKMSDAPLTACPDCGGKVQRLLGTGAGLIFKGGGFYETDYRNSGYKAAAAKDKAPASCPSGGDCSKCEKAN